MSGFGLRKASNFDGNAMDCTDCSYAARACPQWLKASFALRRSSGFRSTGVVSVPNTAAPPGVAQIFLVLGGNLISKESSPYSCSKRGLYAACESLNAMHAVSGLPISWVSTGGCCACSASGFLSRYPVARESQKFPPKKRPCSSLNWSTGKNGEYV